MLKDFYIFYTYLLINPDQFKIQNPEATVPSKILMRNMMFEALKVFFQQYIHYTQVFISIFLPYVILAIFIIYIYQFIKDITATGEKMHSIPCTKCQFFTKNYCLKCTVHPYKALTEEAIGCTDYAPTYD